MRTKDLMTSAILLTVGLILHLVIPPIFLGVKPDFLLAMMFFAIMIVRDIKTSLVIGIVAGLLSAATTGFPGGQIPNFVEKVIVSIAVYQMCRMMDFELSLFKVIMINIIGTLLSGGLFLLMALPLIGQLHLYFASLPVVLIAAGVNATMSAIIYKGVHSSSARFKVHPQKTL